MKTIVRKSWWAAIIALGMLATAQRSMGPGDAVWNNLTNNPALIVSDKGWVTFAASKTSLAAALAAIGKAPVTLVLPPGLHRGDGIATPRTLVLEAPQGSRITVGSGATCSLNGPFQAGPYQVFDCQGTGKVVLAAATQVNYVWFGPAADGTTNDKAVIQKALEAVTCTAALPGKLIIPQGYNSGIDVSGGGVALKNNLHLVLDGTLTTANYVGRDTGALNISNCSNVEISGKGQILGPSNETNTIAGIYTNTDPAQSATNIHVKGLNFEGLAQGINWYRVTRFSIRNTSYKNLAGTWGGTGAQSGSAICLTSCKEGEIDGFNIKNAYKCAVYIQGDVNNSSPTLYCEKINISNGYIHSTDSATFKNQSTGIGLRANVRKVNISNIVHDAIYRSLAITGEASDYGELAEINVSNYVANYRTPNNGSNTSAVMIWGYPYAKFSGLTLVNSDTFTVAGNQTAYFAPGRCMRITSNGKTYPVRVISGTYKPPKTTVNISESVLAVNVTAVAVARMTVHDINLNNVTVKNCTYNDANGLFQLNTAYNVNINNLNIDNCIGTKIYEVMQIFGAINCKLTNCAFRNVGAGAIGLRYSQSIGLYNTTITNPSERSPGTYNAINIRGTDNRQINIFGLTVNGEEGHGYNFVVKEETPTPGVNITLKNLKASGFRKLIK